MAASTAGSQACFGNVNRKCDWGIAGTTNMRRASNRACKQARGQASKAARRPSPKEVAVEALLLFHASYTDDESLGTLLAENEAKAMRSRMKRIEILYVLSYTLTCY